MKKILFFSMLILILIGTNILTGIISKKCCQLISVGQIFMSNIESGERNKLFLQALIERLEKNDPEIVNELRQIRGKFIFSTEGSNLINLINQH